MSWVYLLLAIFLELIGTSALKASDGFQKIWSSLLVLVSYVSSFYFLSLSIRVLPLGVSYAIWSGVGVVAISLIGWIFYKQNLDFAAMLGIGLIVIGVLTIHLFSKSV